jgi:hypothetical protein
MATDLNATASVSGVNDMRKMLGAEDTRPVGVEDGLDGGAILDIGGAEEEACVAACTEALAEGDDGIEADAFWLRQCVRVHKNVAEKATERYRAYFRWRGEFGITNEPDPGLAEHLATGTIRYTRGQDCEGRPVINLRMRNHQPSEVPAARVVRTYHAVIEYVLRTNPNAQVRVAFPRVTLVGDLWRDGHGCA